LPGPLDAHSFKPVLEPTIVAAQGLMHLFHEAGLYAWVGDRGIRFDATRSGGPKTVDDGAWLKDGPENQFMATVLDNEPAAIIGVSAGGDSNTCEWEEVLRYPWAHQPVGGFMWSIGHTIRPNGEVMEGNPADVTYPLPLPSENAGHDYEILLPEACPYPPSLGFEVEG